MNETPQFVQTPTPTDGKINKLIETIAGREIRPLARRGLLGDVVAAPDRLAENEPVRAGLLQASVVDTAVTGERAGQAVDPAAVRAQIARLELGAGPLDAARQLSADTIVLGSVILSIGGLVGFSCWGGKPGDDPDHQNGR